jgi:hypothetical protein
MLALDQWSELSMNILCNLILFFTSILLYQDSLVCSLLLSTAFEDDLDMYVFSNFTEFYPFNKNISEFFDIYTKKYKYLSKLPKNYSLICNFTKCVYPFSMLSL